MGWRRMADIRPEERPARKWKAGRGGELEIWMVEGVVGEVEVGTETY